MAIAGCKINLGLRIVGQREDGYHLLDSLFYPLPEPFDRLSFSLRSREATRPSIEVITDCPGIDCANNTLTKAFALFSAATKSSLSLRVELEKGIPWGAGLGGGSSDAACLLRYLAEQIPLPEEELAKIATRVGADVPFFLYNRPMHVTGIGDCLEPATVQLDAKELLLVCPDIQVSTPWAYKAYDAHKFSSQKPLTKTGEIARSASLFCSGKACFVNDLEPVVFSSYPQVAKIKDELFSLGAQAAAMSGSGAAVFGIFQKQTDALHAKKLLASFGKVFHMQLNTGM